MLKGELENMIGTDLIIAYHEAARIDLAVGHRYLLLADGGDVLIDSD